MTREKPTLLLLGIPPPFGGGEILGGLVAECFKDIGGYEIFSYSRSRGSKSTQGRATFGNLIFGCRYIAKCIWLIVKLRPKKLFLSIPKNFGAFARSAPVILFAVLMRTKVCGELAGARFLFLERGWQKVIGLFVLRRMHSIHFLGEHVRDHHAAYELRNPVVFSNGVMIAENRQHAPLSAEGSMELLYVGALNRSKGVGRLIRSVRLCRENGCDVSCTLMGEWSDPELKQEMEQFMDQHQLRDHIHFAGLIKGDEKWDYYRRAFILVHPTAWDGQPLTILEAIGMGLAVISTPVGAIPDTVHPPKNGILLEENTPEKLYEAISDLYMDRHLLAQIMEYNRTDFDQRFTVGTYLQNLEHWLETV